MKNIIYIILISLVSCTQNDSCNKFLVTSDTEYGKTLVLDYSDTIGNHVWEDGTITQHQGVYLIFHDNEEFDTLFVVEGANVIKSDIYNIKSNDSFIIVDQKPLDLIFGMITSTDTSPYRPHKPKDSWETERIMNQTQMHRYWIISKATKNIYGGYSKEKFSAQCEELGLPDNMSFED